MLYEFIFYVYVCVCVCLECPNICLRNPSQSYLRISCAFPLLKQQQVCASHVYILIHVPSIRNPLTYIQNMIKKKEKWKANRMKFTRYALSWTCHSKLASNAILTQAYSSLHPIRVVWPLLPLLLPPALRFSLPLCEHFLHCVICFVVAFSAISMLSATRPSGFFLDKKREIPKILYERKIPIPIGSRTVYDSKILANL